MVFPLTCLTAVTYVPLHTDVDLSSVVSLWQQKAIYQHGPLDGHGCQQHVKPWPTETISYEERGQESKPHEYHHMNILEFCKKDSVSNIGNAYIYKNTFKNLKHLALGSQYLILLVSEKCFLSSKPEMLWLHTPTATWPRESHNHFGYAVWILSHDSLSISKIIKYILAKIYVLFML